MLCIPRLQKRTDKKRSFGHIYPVVPPVEQQLYHHSKAEHDGVLCNQHGCRLATICDDRVEGDAVGAVVREMVETDSSPSPLSPSSSPALVQLASVALQPATQPHDNRDGPAPCAHSTQRAGAELSTMSVLIPFVTNPLYPVITPTLAVTAFSLIAVVVAVGFRLRLSSNMQCTVSATSHGLG